MRVIEWHSYVERWAWLLSRYFYALVGNLFVWIFIWFGKKIKCPSKKTQVLSMSLCSFLHQSKPRRTFKIRPFVWFSKAGDRNNSNLVHHFFILLNKPGFLTQHTLSLLCWVWLVNAVLAPANTSHIVINLCTLQINLLCVVHAIVIVLVHKNKRLSPIRQTKSTIHLFAVFCFCLWTRNLKFYALINNFVGSTFMGHLQ